MGTHYTQLKICNVSTVNINSIPNACGCLAVNDNIYGMETLVFCGAGVDKQSNICLNLNLDNIRKMIVRFLIEKKIPLRKLAKQLGVTAQDLSQFSSKKGLVRLAYKINLPLVKLYCKTSWAKKTFEKTTV